MQNFDSFEEFLHSVAFVSDVCLFFCSCPLLFFEEVVTTISFACSSHSDKTTKCGIYVEIAAKITAFVLFLAKVSVSKSLSTSSVNLLQRVFASIGKSLSVV